MSRIQATFHGWGNWANNYTPNPSGFQQEINSQGWNTSNWYFVQTGSNGGVTTYDFRFDVDEQTTAGTPDINSIRNQLYTYLSYYFSQMSLQVTTSNVTGGGTSGGTGNGTYTVQSGDTMSRIAARFGMTLQQLLALNPQITNPNVISVGQIINVSGSGAAATVPVITHINNNGTPVVGGSVPVTAFGSNPVKSDGINSFAKGLGLSVSALAMIGILGVAVISRRR